MKIKWSKRMTNFHPLYVDNATLKTFTQFRIQYYKEINYWRYFFLRTKKMWSGKAKPT